MLDQALKRERQKQILQTLAETEEPEPMTRVRSPDLAEGSGRRDSVRRRREGEAVVPGRAVAEGRGGDHDRGLSDHRDAGV